KQIMSFLKYSEWLKVELQKGNIAFYEYSLFENVIKDIGKDTISEETIAETSIINRNRRPLPILTRNVPHTLSVGPSAKVENSLPW
ncbi:14918_t:CDS:2, partial [Dentiscutata heterogama]